MWMIVNQVYALTHTQFQGGEEESHRANQVFYHHTTATGERDGIQTP